MDGRAPWSASRTTVAHILAVNGADVDCWKRSNDDDVCRIDDDIVLASATAQDASNAAVDLSWRSSLALMGALAFLPMVTEIDRAVMTVLHSRHTKSFALMS